MESEINTDIVVVGAGLIGVSTAYELARRGARVTLIDRCEQPAMETSHANGGQLSACEAAPWAGPEVFGLLSKWIASIDAPLRFQPRLSREQWRWLFMFLRRCNAEARAERVPHNIALALYSRACMDAAQQAVSAAGTPLAFDEARLGILRIFRETQDLEAAAKDAEAWSEYGLQQAVFTPGECQRLEPALRDICTRGEIAGGIYCPDDRSGDAAAYTQQLASAAESLGVTFAGNVEVDAIEARNGRVIALSAGGFRFEADHFVIAAATGSRALLAPLGLKIPVYPVKGYSITMPAGEQAPYVSISDEEHKIVISRLGKNLRAAGKADIGGYDNSIVDVRARSILRSLVELFPKASGSAAHAKFWAGLRPMTPDGSPIIDRAPNLQNLWLNTGHGTLGWTLSAGSGALLASMLSGEPLPVDQTAFSLARFGT